MPAASQQAKPQRDNKLQLLVCAIVLAVAGPGLADAAPRVSKVHIVSRVRGSDAVASTQPKREKAKPGVELFAVLAAVDGKRTTYYSKLSTVRIGRKTVHPKKLELAPAHNLLWYRVEPTSESMSNTESGSFRFEAIEYRETVIAGATGKASVLANVRPTLTPDRGRGTGTMRFKLVARSPLGHTVSSPGADARRGRGSGGLKDAVHRISLRTDDSYLGYLSEMNGQPYIWASAGHTDRNHQSERLEGSDCADFVTYGWRRMGHKVPYTWSEGLRKFARTLAKGRPDESGVYRDRKGKPVPFSRVGDLILFPRHVGVLVEDRGTKGVLDHEDIMFHTLFASPSQEAIGRTSYASKRAEILRWRGAK